MTKGVALHWFRKGIRLHDNPALVAACKHKKFFGVYCLDPAFAKPSIVGYNRYKFLLESLQDLDVSLRCMGSRLFVLKGKPKDMLLKFATDHEVTTVTFESDTEPYANIRDKEMMEAFETLGISVSTHSTHTLRDPREYIEACRKQKKAIPNSYIAFCKLFESLGPLRQDVLPPDSVPPYSSGEMKSAGLKGNEYDVPTMEEMGYGEPDFDTTVQRVVYRGGESEALRRLEATVTARDREQWVRSFEKPKTAPNSIEPSTTVLSPYMKFGCLSAVRFFHALDRVIARGRRTEPPVSLHGQLLWREFFYLSSYTTPNFDKMEGNAKCRQIDWERNAKLIDDWKFARTGYPFIDAIMTQLRVEGWIHHLARHAVACFLTRGDLYQHWEEGAKVFELWLLDADWALNTANWQWLSCSNFYYQYFRVYSPVAFGKKTDPDGAYIRHWLPQLARYPAKYIYSPWEASAEQQRQWGCVLGEHYPHRIVEHGSASKECMGRMQQAYAADKARRSREGGIGEEEGEEEDDGGDGGEVLSGSSAGKGKKRKHPASAETASAAQQTLISSFFKK